MTTVKEAASTLEWARENASVPLFLSRSLRFLIAVDVFAMMALMFFDVLMRYLFNAPIPGGFEVIQFMLAILIFSALPVVTWSNGHITVSLLDGLFKGLSSHIKRLSVMSVSALALGLITYLLWHQADSLQISQQTTGFLRLPIYPIALVMFGFSVIACLIQITMIGHLLWRRGRST